MQVQAALFAEQIIEHFNGTFDLIGVTNEILTFHLPYTIPKIALFLVIEYDPAEEDEIHTATYNWRDPDGKQIGQALTYTLQFAVEDPWRHRILTELRFYSEIQISQYGEHFLEISWDGKLLRRVPLYVYDPDN